MRKISQGVMSRELGPSTRRIDRIEVTRRSKVRRARLYYLRQRTAVARLKERR